MKKPTKNSKLLIKTFALAMFAACCSFGLSSCSSAKGQDEIAALTDIDPVTMAFPAEDSLSPASTDGTAVANAALCTSIENREPVGIATTFPSDVGRVYFYTKVTMPAGEAQTIKHVWKHEGKIISTVSLDVQGPSWRTRSYKTIHKGMSGDWTVEAIAESGAVIEAMSFTIE